MGSGKAPEKENYGGVIAIVYSATNTVIVIDPSHPDPRKKFPGGGMERGETPAEAAARELFEETGIKMPARAFHEFSPVVDGKHYMFARASDRRLKKHTEKGRDGEIPSIVTLQEIASMPDFLNEIHKFLARIAQEDNKTRFLTGPEDSL